MIDLRALGPSPDPRQRVGQPRCQRAMVCRFSYLAIRHPRRRWLATGEGGIRHWRKVSQLGPARRSGLGEKATALGIVTLQPSSGPERPSDAISVEPAEEA